MRPLFTLMKDLVARGKARAFAKLDERSGDSFAEAMVALLIAALGTAALVTMTVTAVNVIAANKAAMDDAYEAEVAMAPSGDIVPTSGTIQITSAELSGNYQVDVDVYENEAFVRYEVHE